MSITAQPRRASILILSVLLLTSARASAQEPAEPAQPSAPHLQELPKRIVKDVRRLATRAPILTLALGGALAAAARPGDRQAVTSLSGNHPAEESLDAGSTLGNGFVQIGGAAAAYGIGAWRHRPALAGLGADLIEAQAVTGLVTQAVKVGVNRRRPDGGHHGFPSGHSSASFATAAVITRHFGWRYGSLAYAGAAYVAASRVADRRHFPSDVVFGAALGIAGAQTLDLATRAGRLTVGGTPVPRGAMITGAWQLAR
jgi:membrane-associated phospholipid phosphatase